MAGISQKTIDQVNTAADIVDVISRYLDINRNNKALCPSHEDHKPSLSILPERQIFNCFTCGKKGGSIIERTNNAIHAVIDIKMTGSKDNYKVNGNIPNLNKVVLEKELQNFNK